MSDDYRTIDCEDWAHNKIDEVGPGSNPKLVHITPDGGNVLGGVKLPNEGMVYPYWHYHYAVQINGNWCDEFYPEGIPIDDFKDRFEERNNILFAITG